MRLSYFISSRIRNKKQSSFSGTLHTIAVASVGFGLAVMIIAFLVLGGFKTTIKNKIYSFSGHFEVTKYSLNSSFEEDPISTNIRLNSTENRPKFVTRVQEYAHKPGLIKANNEVDGVLLKGIDQNFDSTDFKVNLLMGSFISFPDSGYSKQIVISSKIANKLNLELGNDVLIYFIQEPVRVRKLTIKGIYETGLEDFDENVIIGDLALIRKLNNWADSIAGGIEVYVDDVKRTDEYHSELYDFVRYDQYIEKIGNKYREIFDWLELLNRNVVILIVITLIVASFNMVSILIILIMERTQMIGMLKALGAEDKMIRQTFAYSGLSLIIKGLLIGNTIAILFGVIQQKFKILTLDPENYYMRYVPVEWNVPAFLGLNALTLLIVGMVLFIPTMIISRINPIKAIRFD